MKRFLFIGEDTSLATKDGYKYVDKLKKGDKILIENGYSTVVVDVMPVPQFNLETLTVNYYDFLNIAGIHTLIAKNKRTDIYEEIKVEDLISGEPYLAESYKSGGPDFTTSYKEQVYKLLNYLFNPGDELPYMGGVITPEFFEYFLNKISKPVECKEGYRLIVSNSETYIEGIKHFLDTFGYTIEYTSIVTDELKNLNKSSEFKKCNESYRLVYKEKPDGFKRVFRIVDREGYRDISLYKKHIKPYIIKLDQIRPGRVLISHGFVKINTLDEEEVRDFLDIEDSNNNTTSSEDYIIDDIDWDEVDDADINGINNTLHDIKEDFKDEYDDNIDWVDNTYYDPEEDFEDGYSDDNYDEELGHIALDLHNREDTKEFMSLMENMFNFYEEEPKEVKLDKEYGCKCKCNCQNHKEDGESSIGVSIVADENGIRLNMEFNSLDQLIDVLSNLRDRRGR